MKSTLYAAGAALLILSSCSTAYKSARTPDDVYYSPKSEKTYASNSNNRQNQGQTSVAAADDQDGTYVTYDDEDQGDYARRLDRFNNPSYSGSYYNDGAPNIYMNNYYGSGFGYSPYSYWGGGFGSPYYGSYWGPSLSIGLGFGWGSGFGYGYSPWAYNPWYSPWYTPYYGGYYGGGYGYGHYPGAYGYAAPSRGYRTRNGFGGTSYSNGNRVIGNSNGSTGGDYRPRRIFSSPNSGGGFNNGSNGSGYQPRRIFRSSPSESPTINPGGNNGGGGRRIFSAPERSSSPAPQRTFSAPSRSFSAPSAPSNSGGGGGGGGRSFRTRN